ncbi:transcription factor NIGT1-like [Panicum virgatum]|uniref:transcription factor NIGT1-like n=1 Tax=Panicum virgatum TaxID=38727 RepID=UPI0019D62D0E|nr:transcription factor NIGT1-like [Panicum virgatum]
MDPTPPRSGRRRRRREYLLALEEERRKIQVFQRELPLCLELVTQTIEGMRSQVDGGSEETVSDHGPVLEELMPLKPSLSLSISSEEHESGAGAGKREEAAETPPPEATKQQATPDWLRSVQLWSQEPQQRPSPPPSPQQPLCKPVALSARKAGGAFQPFEKQKKRAEAPASSATTAAAVVGDSSDGAPADTDAAGRRPRSADKETSGDAEDKGSDRKDGKGGGEEGQSQAQAPARKPRRCWAPELHRRFLQALQQLGGSHVATPKQIRELMKVDGLTNDEVKSHLQKYRLHTRRPNAAATVQSTGTSTAPAPPVPQFIVVGGIWVPPPPEYAAAAAQPAGGNAPGTTTTTAAGTVYAPVATLPSGVQRPRQGPPRQSSGCSDGRRSGDASSGSPAVSSSSHTTSA